MNRFSDSFWVSVTMLSVSGAVCVWAWNPLPVSSQGETNMKGAHVHFSEPRTDRALHFGRMEEELQSMEHRLDMVFTEAEHLAVEWGIALGSLEAFSGSVESRRGILSRLEERHRSDAEKKWMGNSLEEAMAFLELGEEKKRLLQEEFSRMWNRMRELEVERAEVKQIGEHRVSVRIPSLREEMTELIRLWDNARKHLLTEEQERNYRKQQMNGRLLRNMHRCESAQYMFVNFGDMNFRGGTYPNIQIRIRREKEADNYSYSLVHKNVPSDLYQFISSLEKKHGIDLWRRVEKE